MHQPGNYLVVLGVTHFSPYLTAFGTIAPGSPPSDIDARGMVCPVTVSCRAEGKSVRRETVQVPAGTFGAIKVTVEYKWVATTPSTTPGGRDVTVWYVPEVKRVVKVSSRNAGTLLSNQNWDLELVSYQLR